MAASCDLGDSFDVSVRCTALVICVCALVSKKCAEGAERRWDDFLLDASKQLFGAMFSHIFFVSILGEGTGSENCEDRWLRSVLDGSWVVFVEFLLLNVVASSLEGAFGDTGDLTTGEYRDLAGAFVPAKYGKQLLVWLGCVLVAGLAEAWLLWQFQSELQVLAEILLIVVSWSPGLELAVVGVLTPCFMGFVQVWITDDFLKLGGLPLSEVVAALAAKVCAQASERSAAAVEGFRGGAGDGRRPLLLAEGGGGGAAERGLFGGGGGGGGRVTIAVADAKGVSEAVAAAAHGGLVSGGAGRYGGGAAGAGAPACGEGLSPKAWFGSPERREEPRPPPKSSLDPDLQQALEGMEYQVARALGCTASARVEAALPLEYPDDPVLHRVLGPPSPARTGAVEAGHGAKAGAAEVSAGIFGATAEDSPELEELKARISQKDALLQRLRNEVRRAEDGGGGGGGGPGPASPMPRRAAVEQPGSGVPRREREVVTQAPAALQSSSSPPPPRQPQPSPLALATAASRQPPPPHEPSTGGRSGGAGDEDPNSALLDGKIAALEAKINRLNPASLGGGGGGPPRRVGFQSSEGAQRLFGGEGGNGQRF